MRNTQLYYTDPRISHININNELIEHYYFNNKKIHLLFHKILLHNIFRINSKLSKWDLSHFQNENPYHSINQRIFRVQDLSDFKYSINVKYYIL